MTFDTPGITEFAYVSLKPEVAKDALKPETTAGHAIDYMINQVLKHPGARYAQWGLSVENPKQLRVFVDWDKVQDHLDYRETEAYRDVQKYLVPILDLDKPLSICHLSPSNTSVFFDAETHPITEIFTMCFPSDLSAEEKTTIEAQAEEFITKALRGPGLCKSAKASWSVEDDVPVPGLEKENPRCIEYVALISWKSIEEHVQNLQLDAFKNSVHLLAGMPRLIKFDGVHVEAQTRWAKDVK